MSIFLGVLLAMTKMPRPPGVHELLFEPEGKPAVRYALSIPQGYRDDEERPLVLSLHFAGHGRPYYGKGMLTTLVEPALEKLGAVIVAPDCPASS